MEKFVMAGGIPVRYSDYGKGTDVICLLHGYLESIEVWEDFGGQLGKEFRIIAIDLPGHGMSDWGGKDTLTMEYMADVVNEVLTKAGVDKCSMVGHSMGGYVLSAIAERHPDKLNSVVFFHSTPNADSPEKAEMRKREIDIVTAGKKDILATTNPSKGFASQNLKRFADKVDELTQQVMMTEDEAIVATLRGMSQRKDHNETIASLGIPTLFIFGRHDNYIPVDLAETVITKQPDAKILWLDNSGHNGFIEEPETVFETLRQFVIQSNVE